MYRNATDSYLYAFVTWVSFMGHKGKGTRKNIWMKVFESCGRLQWILYDKWNIRLKN